MAWLKIESSVARHRKFVQAGPAAAWLWVCGLAYCQEGLTDGFIPREALAYLGVKNLRPLVSHLVAAGLWDEVDDGWQVHDYLAHNKPASEIRRINSERRAGGKLGGRPNPECKPSDKDKVIDKANLTENPAVAVAEDQQQRKEKISAEPLRDSTPVVLTFQTVGNGTTWDLHESQVLSWRASYPATDIVGECRKAHAWLEANPAKRKTARGMPAFLVNWLNRAVDRPQLVPTAKPNPFDAGRAERLAKWAEIEKASAK